MTATSRASNDCSLLAHAPIPSQRTPEAEEAFRRLLAEDWELVATPALYLEFSGLLLKLRNKGTLRDELVIELFEVLMDVRAQVEPMSPSLMRRAWQIARDLGQSDTNDALGLAAAERHDAEFWTSDRRFANAAANRSLDRVVYVS